MVTIREYVQNDLRSRLKKAECLVLYDHENRYRELCLQLSSDEVQVIDASAGSIDSRLSALTSLRELATSKPRANLLVYVPAKNPIGDLERQRDPFALYAIAGGVFPADDADEFFNICLRAKPNHATAIRQVFSTNPFPSFDAIDAIGRGVDWPQLRAALKVDSASDILFALLAPSDDQAKAFKTEELWSQEARAFLRATLGMEVKTRSKTFSPLSEELWRFILFSEFVFDLPGPLPQALALVPRATSEAKSFVAGMCDRLRNHPRARLSYIEHAEEVEKELILPDACRDIQDLGNLDTFPFEERSFLRRAIDGILNENADLTRRMLTRQEESVWVGKGESQSQWAFVRAALNLVEACEDLERQLPDRSRSQEALLDFYTQSLREADRLQREFEQARGFLFDQYELLGEVESRARVRYRRLAEKVQTVFVRHLETTGWPPPGRLANGDVYDRFVGEPLKESGHKVAYFMIDALRYELGVALEKSISEDGPVLLHTAFAQAPTITPVGMASLLPGAKLELFLDCVGDSLVPKLAGAVVSNVNQRMDVFRKRLGDRFHEMTLNEFVRTKVKLPKTVDLLVLRSTEIDSQLENNPETTLELIPGILRMIRVALNKLRDLGFHEAVIATDHGFFLNAHAEAGDVCVKPQGNWPIVAHDRIMLGDGVADSHSFVHSANRLGIKGAFSQCAGPRSMAPYRAGHLYFHGGLSLSEAVLPVLVARLERVRKAEKRTFDVELSYRGGAKKITTRIPVFEVELFSENLFSQQSEVEVLLEAQDDKGNVVGEPKPGGDVNPASRTITLVPNERKQIALRMDPDFEGKFTVRALDAITLAMFNQLKLETDYLQ